MKDYTLKNTDDYILFAKITDWGFNSKALITTNKYGKKEMFVFDTTLKAKRGFNRIYGRKGIWKVL